VAALTWMLIGSDGKLRAIWRALIFYVAGTWAVFPLVGVPAKWIARAPHLGDGLTAANIGLGELQNLLVALICTGAFALYEGRRVDSYGLPVAGAFSPLTFEGAAAGFAMAGAVAAGMAAVGGMQVFGLAHTAQSAWLSALAWLGANLCVGIAEEAFYRGYLLQTLWKVLGFWPASVVIALVFAADHYFYKAGENVWDVITLVSFSLLCCYSVLKTGSLWFAVGFHFAFDYMQLFVIGTPNGSRVPEGRLFDVRFTGPAWLNGGVLGTEASVLMYPALALLGLYLWWRRRGMALA